MVVRIPVATRLVCATFLVVALLAPVQAGTADKPEVTDPSADVTTNGAPACSPTGCETAPLFVDLKAAWVASEDPTALTFDIDVYGNKNANVYGAAEFDFHFTVLGKDYIASFNVAAANQAGGLPGSGAVTPGGVASSAAYNNALMELVVPKSAIGDPVGGSLLTHLFVTSSETVAAGKLTDRAPDGAAYGTDYALLSFVTKPTYTNLTGADLALSFKSTTRSNQTAIYNWTNAQADVDLAYSAAVGNGTVHVLVKGPANHTILDTAFPGPAGKLEVKDQKGAWQVTLRLANFTGAVNLTSTPHLTTNTTASTTSHAVATNGTRSASSSSTTKGSPAGSGLLAVGLAAVGVAMRRSRRGRDV